MASGFQFVGCAVMILIPGTSVRRLSWLVTRTHSRKN